MSPAHRWNQPASTIKTLVGDMPLSAYSPNRFTQDTVRVTEYVGGPTTYPTVEAMFEATAAVSPRRDRAPLRRGVLHNARQLEDRSWAWRHDRLTPVSGNPRDFIELWQDLARADASFVLVRGGASRFVRDQDTERFTA